MFITAGLLNMLCKHYKTTDAEISEILAKLKYDYSILQYPTEKVDANILGCYLEHIVNKTGNSRIGLETGFLLPFVLTGIFFNIYNQSKTVREVFQNEEPFDPAINDIYTFVTKEDEFTFSLEISIKSEFRLTYPVASRQWVEMQCGFFLQYAYSFTGRFLRPNLVYSMYEKEGIKDKLEEYLDCPVKYNHDKLVLIFNKAILDLPIVTGNREMLSLFEDYMNEIQICETKGQNRLSQTVRRFLIHSLLNSDLSLNYVAHRFNMSERNIQRKLKIEGTSYQKILDDLRIELSQKYLRERISLPEISFLLGFESQSAFNKFFRKHFHVTPGQYK